MIVAAKDNEGNQNKVIFQAEETITLLPGFSTEDNAEFIAQTDDCPGPVSFKKADLEGYKYIVKFIGEEVTAKSAFFQCRIQSLKKICNK